MTEHEVVVKLSRNEAEAARQACERDYAQAAPRSEERAWWRGAADKLDRCLYSTQPPTSPETNPTSTSGDVAE